MTQYEGSPCPECGGQREYFDYNTDAQIWMGLTSRSPLQALVCLSCGSTSLYVPAYNLGTVRKFAEKRRGKG